MLEPRGEPKELKEKLSKGRNCSNNREENSKKKNKKKKKKEGKIKKCGSYTGIRW